MDGLGLLAAGRPELQPKRLELGNIPPDRIKVLRIRLYNNTDKTVKIQRATADCPSCTTIERAIKTIRPRKAAILKVYFDPADFSGLVKKQLRIMTDEPKIYRFYFSARVAYILQAEPRYLLSGFKSLSASKWQTKTVRLHNRTGKKILIQKIDFVEKKYRFVSLSSTPAHIDPGKSVALVLAVKKPTTPAQKIQIQEVRVTTDFLLRNRKKKRVSVYITVTNR